MDKILVVDDEKEIADLIEIYLHNEGFEVIKLYESEKVLPALEGGGVALIVMDIMMAGMDGITLCQKVRQKYNIPIIMLSAKSMDIDKITGLSSGADDYMTKPFNPVELLARVRAQLRRFMKLNPMYRSEDDSDMVEVSGLTLNRKSFEVTYLDADVTLTPIQFEILFLLASNRNRVLSAEEIFETIWGEKYFEASGNTVMVHIRNIREKLKDDSRNPKLIKTVWGVGYKIEG